MEASIIELVMINLQKPKAVVELFDPPTVVDYDSGFEGSFKKLWTDPANAKYFTYLGPSFDSVAYLWTCLYFVALLSD